MHALQGSKTNIYTHNEVFANEAFDKVAPLAQMFELKVADKKSNKQEQRAADILCMDISNAVINQTLDQYQGNPVREAQVDLSDEIDNQVDIQAKTTMQISASQQTDKTSQEELERFLDAFTTAFELLKNEVKLIDIEKQVEFIQGKLKEKLSPQSKYQEANSIKFWLAAMASSCLKEKNKDYIIENKLIRIVHHKTTGRVDRESIWGEGVHQCVAALERKQGPEIIINPLSQVVAEGNIAGFYKSSKQKRYGFSGTLGDDRFAKKIADVLGTERKVVMPRAQRPEVENAQWPLVADSKGGKSKRYNRAYRFAPIIAEDNSKHLDVLLDMVATIRQNNQSGIIFFNTIEECEEFRKVMLKAGEHGPVQIFDDTAPADKEGDVASDGFKKTQKTAIKDAANPKMITLTTAAGSRGADFKDVSVGIIASFGLLRVLLQKAGRIARDIAFGTIYEVYSRDQLDEQTKAKYPVERVKHTAEVRTKPSVYDPKDPHSNPNYDRANMRFGLDEMEASMQKQDLDHLESREELDKFKESIQQEYSDLGYKSAKWPTFFASIQPGKNIEELRASWGKVRKEIDEEHASSPNPNKSD